jgi:hypothetical protein
MSSMDPFRLCLALGPVAIYLLLLGVVNLSRQTLLVSGGRDAAALALAISGLMLAGPMELLVPFEAEIFFGPYVWILLPVIYVMCVVLWLLTMRPRLVLYNTTADKLRPVLADVVARLDAETRWAGDCIVLPGLDVQLFVDGFPALRSVSLIAAGGRQSQSGWRRLEAALTAAVAREEVARNPRGLFLIAAGLLCLSVLVFVIARDPNAMVQSLLGIAHALLQMAGLEK